MKHEIILDVKDLLLHILLRWRRILFWMLIFVIGLNSVSVIKSYNAVKRWEYQVQEAGEEAYLSDYTVNLSTQEKKEVEDVFKSYLAYQTTYDNSLDYYNNSIKMHLDPTAVDTIELQYHVYGSEKTADIISAYELVISDDELYGKIIDSLGWKTETSYIKELIQLKEADSVQKSGEIKVEQENIKDLMTIRIVAPEKEDCELIEGIIEQEITAENKDLQAVYGDYTIQKTYQTYYKGVDDDLLQSQQTLVSNLRSLKDSINVLKNNFTEEQKNYYEALIENEENNDTKKAEQEETALIVNPTVQYVNIKYCILGAFIGAFIYVVCVFVAYIMRGTLRSSHDMEEYFGINNIGIFVKNKKDKKYFGNKIDIWLKNIFRYSAEECSENDMLRMVCLGIEAIANKTEVTKIQIIGSSMSEETEMIKNNISKELKASNLDVAIGNSLQDILASDGIVIVEQIGGSYYSAIQREVECCIKYKVPIIGSVVVE